jgi:hypothetical protein
LRLRDFNHVEKIAKPPRLLTMAGFLPATTPRSTTSATTLLGDLVLYYGDVGY